MDACGWDCLCAGPALLTGIIYGNLDEAFNVVKNWDSIDILSAYKDAPKKGFKTSLNKKDLILEDIKKKFIIRDVYEINWSRNEFVNNLKRFYGTMLENSAQKANLCGTGPFLLIVILRPFIKALWKNSMIIFSRFCIR